MSKSSTTIKRKLTTKSLKKNRKTGPKYGPVRLPPIHPGEMLLDELKARRVTQHRFATHIRVSPAYLSDIIKGRRGISAEMAYKIGQAFGTGPVLWADLQKNYELSLVDEEKLADIGVIAA